MEEYNDGDVQVFSTFLPLDRQYALARATSLPDRATGAALFADLSGFTALTSAFALALGPRRGAEDLTHHLNAIYEALTGTVRDYGGSVIGFSGDALTCWFDDLIVAMSTASASARALQCALDMQALMPVRGAITTPDGSTVRLTLKISIAAGAVRRFVVGDPAIQQIDVLAGRPLDRVAEAEHLATGGEIVVDAAVIAAVEDVRVREWRTATDSSLGYAVVEGTDATVAPVSWPPLSDAERAVVEQEARRWLLRPVRQRLEDGPEQFLAEFRPAVALFMAFDGIDYDDGHGAADQIDAYVRWVQHVLERSEGSLIQITIGDKGSYLYAVFGAPVAHDDDAQRAMHAAQELLRPPPALGFIGNIRIGLAEGVMWTGAYGGALRRTYGVLGDKTNLAARLMEHARPGTVVCDDDVFVRARNRWRFETLAPVQFKGRESFTAIHRPLAEQDTLVQSDAAGTFVGRAAEYERMVAALDTILTGRRRVVVIAGEAGIGKSRLLGRFVHMLVARRIDVLAGVGRSIEQQTPYRAWRDVFAAYFGLADEDDIASRTRHVETLIQTIAPQLRPRLPLLNELLTLDLPESDLTRSLDVALRSENLDRLLLELIRVRAESHPFVLILEDAHWLDSRSWEMVGRVVRELDDVPLLFVMAMRPLEPEHGGASLLDGLATQPDVERIDLVAMEAEDVLHLASVRLGVAPEAVPGEVRDLLRARAGGNPFFAEELVSALLESGLVWVENDPVLGPLCGVARDLEAANRDLPGTLQGLILSRIDRLPLDEQLTLKVASVIGPRFGVASLLYMRNQQSDVPEPVLDEHLRDLTVRDFTAPEAEVDPWYRFRHVLTQEAAYQMLLFAQRRSLHRLIAGWYEQTFKENDAQFASYLPLLAYHYRYAEEPERERHFARLAGIQAARQFANAEAVAYFTRALHLTSPDDHAERFDLLLRREAVYDVQALREPQRADLDALTTLAEGLDERRRAEVALRMSNFAEWTGDYVAMAASAQRAQALAAAANWIDGEAAAYMRLGRSYGWRCVYDHAYAAMTKALRLARVGAVRHVEAESLRSLGMYAVLQGRYSEGRAHYEQSLRSFREAGDTRGEAYVLNNLGVAANEEGDNQLARQWYEQALRCMYTLGDRRGEAMVMSNLGIVAQDTGDVFAAQTQYERTLQINRDIRDRYSEGISLVNLGSTFLALGEYDTAQQLYEQSYQIRIEIGDRQGEGIMLGALGNLAACRGAYETALDYAEHAYAIACEINAFVEQVAALVYKGHALRGLERWQEALAAYQEAWILHGDTPRLGRDAELRVYAAHAALAAGDHALAREHCAVAVPHVLQPPLDGAEHHLLVYLMCYEVLQGLDDPRAPRVIEHAREQLMHLVSQLEDEERRRAILEAVPMHRTILRLWHARHEPNAP